MKRFTYHILQQFDTNYLILNTIITTNFPFLNVASALLALAANFYERLACVWETNSTIHTFMFWTGKHNGLWVWVSYKNKKYDKEDGEC